MTIYLLCQFMNKLVSSICISNVVCIENIVILIMYVSLFNAFSMKMKKKKVAWIKSICNVYKNIGSVCNKNNSKSLQKIMIIIIILIITIIC